MSTLFPWLTLSDLLFTLTMSIATAVLWTLAMRWMMPRIAMRKQNKSYNAAMAAMGWAGWFWQGLAFGCYMLLFRMLDLLIAHYQMPQSTFGLIVVLAILPALAIIPVVRKQGEIANRAMTSGNGGSID